MILKLWSISFNQLQQYFTTLYGGNKLEATLMTAHIEQTKAALSISVPIPLSNIALGKDCTFVK
jgi:hypothetical protein